MPTGCPYSKAVVSKTAATALDITTESVKATEVGNCASPLIDNRTLTDQFAMVSNIQPKQQVGAVIYHLADYRSALSNANASALKVALTYKNNNAVCIITSQDRTEIEKQINAIADPIKNTSCLTKSSPAFSTLAPKTVLATGSYQLAASLDPVSQATEYLAQLNTLGQQGYALLHRNIKTTSSGSPENLYLTNSKQQQRYAYTSKNLNLNSLDIRYARWFDEAKAQAANGYLPFSSHRAGSSLNFTHYFVKKTSASDSYTLDYKHFYPAATVEDMIAGFNELGAKGCKLILWDSNVFVGAQTTLANTNTVDIATCANSSTHNGTYSYVYVKKPMSSVTEPNTAEINTIIQNQLKAGYRLVSSAFYVKPTETEALLFEKDSSKSTATEYKVFAENALRLNNGSANLLRRLNEQGKIGWLYTGDGYIFSSDPNSMIGSLTGVNLP